MTGFQHIDGMIFFLYRYFIYFSLVYWSPHEMCVNIHLILTLQGFLWYCSEIKDKNWKALLISWAMSENKTHQLPLWQCAAAIVNIIEVWMKVVILYCIKSVLQLFLCKAVSVSKEGEPFNTSFEIFELRCRRGCGHETGRGNVFWPAAAVTS